MAHVEIAAAAREQLAVLIDVLSLPDDTRPRVRSSIARLADHSRIGQRLPPPLEPARWIIGPWKWMVIVYVHDEQADVVRVVAIEDGRSPAASSHTPSAPARHP